MQSRPVDKCQCPTLPPTHLRISSSLMRHMVARSPWHTISHVEEPRQAVSHKQRHLWARGVTTTIIKAASGVHGTNPAVPDACQWPWHPPTPSDMETVKLIKKIFLQYFKLFSVIILKCQTSNSYGSRIVFFFFLTTEKLMDLVLIRMQSLVRFCVCSGDQMEVNVQTLNKHYKYNWVFATSIDLLCSKEALFLRLSPQ